MLATTPRGARPSRKITSIIAIISPAINIIQRWISPDSPRWRDLDFCLASKRPWHRSCKAGSPATSLQRRARRAKQATDLLMWDSHFWLSAAEQETDSPQREVANDSDTQP